MFARFAATCALLSAVLLPLSGCYNSVAVRGPVPPPVVIYHDRTAPPPVTVEDYHPRVGYVWVRGHWRWGGNRYVWIRGHYRHSLTVRTCAIRPCKV